MFGYVGFPGGGKTYALCEALLRDRAAGAQVFANFHLGQWRTSCDCESPSTGHARMCIQREFVPYNDCSVIRSWDDLMDLKVARKGGRLTGSPISIGLDELNLWAPSRMWADLPLGLLYKWSHTRKHGLTVYWTAQAEQRVDTVVREVTEVVTFCKRIGPRTGPLGFLRSEWLPNEVNKSGKGRRLGMSVTRFRRGVATSFDTYEDVAPSDHLGKKKAKRSRD